MSIKPDNESSRQKAHLDYEAQLRDANEELLLSSVHQHELIEKLEIAEKALSYLGLVVASSIESIITIDFDGIITTWNKSAERLYGYPAAEAVGKSITMLTFPEDLKQVLGNIESIKQGGAVEIFDTIRIQKGGADIDLEILMSPVTAADGRVIGVATIARDITERIRLTVEREAFLIAEKERKASELAGVRVNESRLAESQMRLAIELAAAQHLQEVSTQLIGTDDPNALYEKILDAAMEITRSQYASIQMLYPERGGGGELWLLGHRGFSPEAAKFWEWVTPASDSACGVALRTGERVIVSNVEADERMAGSEDQSMCLQTGVHAIQTTPLVSRGGRVLGMLSTLWNRPHNPSERDLRLLDVLARQAADLIERSQTEIALSESRKRYRTLFEMAPMAVFACDHNGVIQHYNEHAANLWGREPESGVERHCGSVNLWLPDGNLLPHEQSPIVEVLRTGLPAVNVEVFIERPDGSRLPVLVNFAALKNERGEVVGAITSFIDITDRKQAEEELRRSREEMEQRVIERTAELADANTNLIAENLVRRKVEEERVRILHQLVTAQESERGRIGRDLHDQLGQQVTALRLKLEAVASISGDNPALNMQVKQAQELAKRVDADVGFLTFELRPTALDDLGIVAAIGNFVNEWSRNHNIATEFHTVPNIPDRLAPETEINVYRIVQEALNNILKHARATNVTVQVEFREATLVLIIEDNGNGFDPENRKAISGNGFGLIGMRERCLLLGGKLEVESAPGKGTVIFVRVPVNTASNGTATNG